MSGQIGQATPFGKELIKLAQNPSYKVFLDIGTWNGLGSTKILVDWLHNDSLCKIYSVEANMSMYDIACSNWKEKPNCLELLYGKFSNEIMTEADVRAHPSFNDVKNHFDLHYYQDVIDFQKAPIVSLPEYVDVVIADGGEFCGLSDMNCYLKLNPKIIALDDVNVMKNCDVKPYLLKNGWVLTAEGNDRNGWAVLRRAD
jgi:hypothetical protein